MDLKMILEDCAAMFLCLVCWFVIVLSPAFCVHRSCSFSPSPRPPRSSNAAQLICVANWAWQ